MKEMWNHSIKLNMSCPLGQILNRSIFFANPTSQINSWVVYKNINCNSIRKYVSSTTSSYFSTRGAKNNSKEAKNSCKQIKLNLKPTIMSCVNVRSRNGYCDREIDIKFNPRLLPNQLSFNCDRVLFIPCRNNSSSSSEKRQRFIMPSNAIPFDDSKHNQPNARLKPDGKYDEGEMLPDKKRNWAEDKIQSIRVTADPYIKLMRLEKPIGSWLLFWPGSWSILLAADPAFASLPTVASTLGLFLAGSFIMRGAGCTINDMWDKDIDAKVARTRDRPLVSGALDKRKALIFLAGQLSVGLAILLQLNLYSIMLGASSLVLVVLYPLAKRVTDYPQLVLGLAFNWGALLGWSAIRGALDPLTCLPLYAAGICWTVLYDTVYAHQDKRDDAIIGVRSTALKFGENSKWYLSALGVSAIGGLASVGLLAELSWPFWVALSAGATHLTSQVLSVNLDNPKDCQDKFVSNSNVGLFIFLGILLGKWETWRRYLLAESDDKQNENYTDDALKNANVL